jgi:hypothetical protein
MFQNFFDLVVSLLSFIVLNTNKEPTRIEPKGLRADIGS